MVVVVKEGRRRACAMGEEEEEEEGRGLRRLVVKEMDGGAALCVHGAWARRLGDEEEGRGLRRRTRTGPTAPP